MRCATLALLAAAAATAEPPAAGDPLRLWGCAPSEPRQRFALSPGGPPLTISLQPPFASLVLDISGPSKAPGTPIHVWGRYAPAVPNQQWAPAGALLQSVYAAGLCLGAAGPYPGAQVAILACNASSPLQAFAYSAASGSLSLPGAGGGLCAQAGGNTTPSCDTAPFSGYPYCNPALPAAARVADLVARMTDDELVAALDSSVPALPRLGVPSLHSGEALHGVASGCATSPAPNSTGCPTSFPCPLALGAALDADLWARVGLAIGTEARALANVGPGALWVFAPNLNPARDGRWGRAQEVPSEDANLVAQYGQAFISGLQGSGAQRHLLVASTAKHYIGYDTEGYIPRTDPQPRPASSTCDTPGGCQRWNMDSFPPQRDIDAYYFPPFAAAVRAGVRSIMCAYSGWQGEPACGSGSLNSELRAKMGWDGHVVSDCTAIELMQDLKWDGCLPPFPPTPQSCTPEVFSGGHNFTHTVGETALVALRAGTDVNCGPFYRVWLGGLLANGTVPRALIVAAVSRLYTSAVLLGVLDPVAAQPYAALGRESIDSAAHRALALEAAASSLVLLKNEGALLPLARSARMAFIGPHANISQALLSNYHGDNVLVNSLTPLLEAQRQGLSVTYARGCNICDAVPSGFPNMPCTQAGDATGIPAAVAAAAAADVAVLFVGLDQTSEAENFDRGSLALPGAQEALALAVLAAQPRTVVVFISGGIVSSPALLQAAPALLQAHYGGEMGGVAIVRALVGQVNPAGKLPLTMYYNNITARDIRDVDLASAGGITHTFFAGPVLLPFMHGLSYTSFSYSAQWGGDGAGGAVARSLSMAALAAAGASCSDSALRAALRVTARVTNTGAMAGDVAVLALLRPRARASASAPRQVLLGFAKARGLQPGEARAVALELGGEAACPFLRMALLAQGAGGEFDLEVGDIAAPALLRLSTTE